MYIPDTTMSFVIENSKLDSEIPEVINPTYIYKKGDTVTYSDILDASLVYKFEVTGITHELVQGLINTDQIVVIYMKHVE